MPEDNIPLVETRSDAKTAVFLAEPSKVGKFTVYPFTAMRRGLLLLTKNEVVNAGEHLKKYCESNGLDLDKALEESQIDLMNKAVPEFIFHMTAVIYICVADRKKLMEASASSEKWREAVFAFWDSMESEKEWNDLAFAAFSELNKADVGNDYKVKEEKGGAAQSPNS